MQRLDRHQGNEHNVLREPSREVVRVGLSRSKQMSRIGPTDTKPEMLLRRALWARGLRYRLGVRLGRSRPDLVFTRQRVAVFVDGCFWHGCPDHSPSFP
jgi:DNA mismatch endonuclease (patch repair protein)